MSTVYIDGKKISLSPSNALGKGGEADVYRHGTGLAIKVFKSPDHPDYAGLPTERQGAIRRLAIHQKKLPSFPHNLPPHVIVPQKLAFNKADNGQIVGYLMQLVSGSDPIFKYGEPGFRSRGIDPNQVVRALLDLYKTVEGLHYQKVVIGDFNDMNVLVSGDESYVIDADSFQFGPFMCEVYTDRFLDPLLAPSGGPMTLAKAWTESSDWYAFSVMAFQSLLLIHPFAGVYKPKDKKKVVAAAVRPLAGVSVLHADIIYPKIATPPDRLPDELLSYFFRTFEEQKRDKFPKEKLEGLRWTNCTSCGTPHARSSCPNCKAAGPAPIKQTMTIRGKVSAELLFQTPGCVLGGVYQGKQFAYTYYENGAIHRENGRAIFSIQLRPDLKVRISGERTLIGENSVLHNVEADGSSKFIAVDACGKYAVFDAYAGKQVWAYNGQLYHKKASTGLPSFIGNVMNGQTWLWTGENYGFGFYRAGMITTAFIFRPDYAGINDSLVIPALGTGHLRDAACVFSNDLIWLFLSTQVAAKTMHRCILIRGTGEILAQEEAESGDGSWLGTLRGKAGAGKSLLAATDEGLVRVELDNGRLVVTRQFPDTETWVDSLSQLVVGADGLYVMNRREIYRLRIS